MEGGALELSFAVQPWKHQARRLRWGTQGNRLKALFSCIILDLGNGIGMVGLVLCFIFLRWRTGGCSLVYDEERWLCPVVVFTVFFFFLFPFVYLAR